MRKKIKEKETKKKKNLRSVLYFVVILLSLLLVTLILLNNRNRMYMNNTPSVPIKVNPIVLNVGNTDTIMVNISSNNIKASQLTYTSSNTKSLTIDSKGKMVAKAKGTGKITIKVKNNSKIQTSIPFTVNPKKGIINGNGGVWKYNTSLYKNHLRADINFFKKLVKEGKGSLKGNIYTFKNSKYTYIYDISKSILNVDKKNILMRMYYPLGENLSMTNTITFFGGTGEQNLKGFFKYLDENKATMDGSGIVILISSKGQYYPEHGVLATSFIKAIVGQKSGVKNAVGGFSMGGAASGNAARLGNYDRLVICNTSFAANKKEAITALKNKEIIVFNPKGDKTTGANSITTLNYLASNNYSNVTVISNNSPTVNNSKYKNFLIINPGNQMGSGHLYMNIVNANLFAYACR